jgi:hypothetical protein
VVPLLEPSSPMGNLRWEMPFLFGEMGDRGIGGVTDRGAIFRLFLGALVLGTYHVECAPSFSQAG